MSETLVTQADEDAAVAASRISQRGKKGLIAPTDSETLRIKRDLAAQDKFSIRLFQTPAGRGEKLPDRTVFINGYGFRITRGKLVSVPQSVYEVLINAGEVDPLEEQFQSLIPEDSEAERYVMNS